MCRNIRTLHNFQPPATEEEVHAAALQFVRKLCGFTRPARANQPAFERAVDQVSEAARELLQSLVTNAPPRDRAAGGAQSARQGRRPFPLPRRGPDQLARQSAQAGEIVVPTRLAARATVPAPTVRTR